MIEDWKYCVLKTYISKRRQEADFSGLVDILKDLGYTDEYLENAVLQDTGLSCVSEIHSEDTCTH